MKGKNLLKGGLQGRREVYVVRVDEKNGVDSRYVSVFTVEMSGRHFQTCFGYVHLCVAVRL